MAKYSKENVVGNVYARLTVISQEGTKCICKCSCGNTSSKIPRHRLLSGNTTSCGCRKRSAIGDSNRTHGRSNSRIKGYADRTYGIWQAMKDRCSNPNRADWYRYGAVGIKVCSEWEHSFEQFVIDMGEAPENLSLDRSDGTKGYSPDNCRWATSKEQALNTKRTITYEMDGILDSISGWVTRLSMTRLRAVKYLESNATKTNK